MFNYCLIWFHLSLIGQQKIVVCNADTKVPLAFVSVVYNENKEVLTSQYGYLGGLDTLSLQKKDVLFFKREGYETLKFKYSDLWTIDTVFLKPIKELEEFTIEAFRGKKKLKEVKKKEWTAFEGIYYYKEAVYNQKRNCFFKDMIVRLVDRGLPNKLLLRVKYPYNEEIEVLGERQSLILDEDYTFSRRDSNGLATVFHMNYYRYSKAF